ELRVERQHAVGDVQQLHDVFQKAAEVGVVVANAGRHLAEVRDELVVHQETFDERPEVRVAHFEQDAAEPFQQLADVVLGVRQEVSQLDRLRIDAVQVAEDDLQGPLEELDLAADLQEIAFFEGAEEVFARVPQPAADGPGAVAQLHLDVEVAV